MYRSFNEGMDCRTRAKKRASPPPVDIVVCWVGNKIGGRSTGEVPGVSGTQRGGRIAEVVESVPRGCGW